MAFYYYQNYLEEAHDARFLPSEYLTFFTSVRDGGNEGGGGGSSPPTA
jgi:hypothetical protein